MLSVFKDEFHGVGYGAALTAEAIEVLAGIRHGARVVAWAFQISVVSIDYFFGHLRH